MKRQQLALIAFAVVALGWWYYSTRESFQSTKLPLSHWYTPASQLCKHRAIAECPASLNEFRTGCMLDALRKCELYNQSTITKECQAVLKQTTCEICGNGSNTQVCQECLYKHQGSCATPNIT